jgi:hypothetical protein
MQRIHSSLRDSFWALLGYASPNQEHADALGRVRQRMLDLLGDSADLTHDPLVQRIRHASEAEALWYARHDLLVALAEVHGEAAARQSIAALNALFAGLLPASLIGPMRHAS